MKDPLLSVVLTQRTKVYDPGATLSGEHQIDAVDPEELVALELSVLWYTEGKGDEDMAVHYFQRLTQEELGPKLHELRRFSTQLPKSPLSYDGLIVKIRWCVRLRIFLRGGRSFSAEQAFQLGRLPCPLPEEISTPRIARVP